MTSRERIMRALKGEMPDQIPWTPLVDGYYLSGLKEQTNQVDAIRHFGGDVFARHIPTYSSTMNRTVGIRLAASDEGNIGEAVTRTITENGNVEIVTAEINGNITQCINTPKGSLRCCWIRNEASPFIPFPIEHRLKSPEDIKIFQYALENMEIAQAYDFFLKEDAYIGDSGIATTSSPSTPFHDLIEIEFGVQNFYYMLYDFKAEMEELMEVMHEQKKKIYSIIAASPAEVVIGYENTSTTTTSPDAYERYCEKQINEYADILHKSGKLYLTHMCGKLKGLTSQLARGRMDGIIDIAPEPTGNVSLAEAKNLWGSEKIVMGGIDATAFKGLSPEEITQYVKKIILDLPKGGGVFLGTGDALPQGTSFENLCAITEAVRKFGQYI